MGIQQLLSVKPLKNLYFESVLEAGTLLPFVLHGTGQMQPSHSSRADRAHIIAQFGQAELEPLEVGFKTTGIQFFVHGLKKQITRPGNASAKNDDAGIDQMDS